MLSKLSKRVKVDKSMFIDTEAADGGSDTSSQSPSDDGTSLGALWLRMITLNVFLSDFIQETDTHAAQSQLRWEEIEDEIDCAEDEGDRLLQIASEIQGRHKWVIQRGAPLVTEYPALEDPTIWRVWVKVNSLFRGSA
jgi:hypothetical protein